MAVLGPASRAQLRQLFTEVRFESMKRLFCRNVLTNLKLRSAPGCAARLVARVEELVRAGLDDTAAYPLLHQLVHDEIYKSPEYLRAAADYGEEYNRAKNRVEQIEPLLRRFLDGRVVRSYLDVGCNEGSITAALGTLLHAEAVHGCDVLAPPPGDPPAFTFALLDPADPYRLPYADASQDVVSAMMSLHHIAELDRTLAEIHRVLRDDGIFIVREHDCDPPSLALLLDLMHGFYAMVWSPEPEMPDFATHFSCYRSRAALTACVERPAGAAVPRFHCVHQTEPLGAWRHYYSVFVKHATWAGQPARVRAWFPDAVPPVPAIDPALMRVLPPAALPPSGDLRLTLRGGDAPLTAPWAGQHAGWGEQVSRQHAGRGDEPWARQHAGRSDDNWRRDEHGRRSEIDDRWRRDEDARRSDDRWRRDEYGSRSDDRWRRDEQRSVAGERDRWEHDRWSDGQRYHAPPEPPPPPHAWHASAPDRWRRDEPPVRYAPYPPPAPAPSAYRRTYPDRPLDDGQPWRR